MTPENLTRQLSEFAESIGFDRIGVTSAAPPDDFDRYRSWVEKGFAADMGYLTEKERIRKRGDLSLLLAGAKSVIVGAVSYTPEEKELSSDAKFGRYAWGRDYHAVLKPKLEEMARWLSKRSKEPFRHAIYVDTGPILERSLAERAGVGWIGKNTCLIAEPLGSYFVLGELITTLELPPDQPATNRCGSCRRCLEVCPTGALAGPYELNAAKCISYHTIESRASAIPEPISIRLNGWVAGCDICQEVCPWNRNAKPARLEEFRPLPHVRLSLEDLKKLDEKRHKVLFAKTSLQRITLRNLKRNAAAASHELLP